MAELSIHEFWVYIVKTCEKRYNIWKLFNF